MTAKDGRLAKEKNIDSKNIGLGFTIKWKSIGRPSNDRLSLSVTFMSTTKIFRAAKQIENKIKTLQLRPLPLALRPPADDF